MKLVIFLCLGLGLSVDCMSENLKVLTLNFNCEAVFEDRHEALREKRFQAAVEWARKNEPDIIMIQEGWNFHGYPSVVIPLANELGYDYAYRIVMGFPGIHLDSDGILVKKNLRFRESESTRLPHSTFAFGDGKTFIIPLGAASWRVGGLVTLTDGSSLSVFSTHLIGTSLEKRNDQAMALDPAVSEGESVLIGGDFNLNDQSEGVKSLVSRGYQDTFQVAHPQEVADQSVCSECNDPHSFHFNPMTIAPGQVPRQEVISENERIDYLFAKAPNLTVLASTLVFTEPLNGVWMSDHYGVLTTFQVGNGVQVREGVSNPISDRVLPESKAQWVELKDDLFECDATQEEDEPCVLKGASIETTPEKGIVFMNHTHHRVKIKLRGEGNIWPIDHARLKPGKVAAFFFEGQVADSYEVEMPQAQAKIIGDIHEK